MVRLSDQFNYHGIYLDSATRGLQPRISLDAQQSYISSASIRMSIHREARKAIEFYENDLNSLSRYFSQPRDRFSVLPNADHAWNIFLRSYVEQHHPQTIYVSIFDHHSILGPVLGLRDKYDYKIHWLDRDELPENIDNGDLLIVNHASLILGTTKNVNLLASVMHADMGRIAIDFSHSAGQHGISLSNVDYAVIDGSMDLLGPQGCALLYIRDELQPSVYGSTVISALTRDEVVAVNTAERFEIGQPDLRALHGMAASVEYLGTIDRNKHREQLHKSLLDIMGEESEISIINQDRDIRTSQMFAMVPENGHSHDWAIMLDEISDIAVRSGGACSYNALKSLGIDDVILISPHIYNTEDDIHKLAEAIDELFSV